MEKELIEKQNACAKEIGEVLKKYGFQLGVQPPTPVLIPMEQKEESKVVKP